MGEVLDLYADPHDPKRPLVCFDETPFQRVGDVAAPMQTRPGRPKRVDYEYEREGTCNLFVTVQPREGWRHVEVTERRTAVNFAHRMKTLVDEQLPRAEVIRVVTDNLNTHTPASLCQAFPAEEARRTTRKLEFHYRP